MVAKGIVLRRGGEGKGRKRGRKRGGKMVIDVLMKMHSWVMQQDRLGARGCMVEIQLSVSTPTTFNRPNYRFPGGLVIFVK